MHSWSANKALRAHVRESSAGLESQTEKHDPGFNHMPQKAFRCYARPVAKFLHSHTPKPSQSLLLSLLPPSKTVSELSFNFSFQQMRSHIRNQARASKEPAEQRMNGIRTSIGIPHF